MDEKDAGYRVNEGQVDSMQLDGEAVLLNLHEHTYFGLNQTATEIWTLITARPGLTSGIITELLAGRYGKEPSELCGDVAELLGDLARAGLAVRCDPENGAGGQLDRADSPYTVPRLETFGELSALILSGE